MTSFALKVTALLLIFLGESFAIYAEIRGAHTFSIMNESFLSVFVKMFPMFVLGAACLISGYILGYRAFQNIWIVSVISVTSILLVEPTLSYLIFHQFPTRGAWIGLACGVMGLGTALFL